MPTGFIYSDRFLEHDAGLNHPERLERLRAIANRLRRDRLWDALVHLPFEPASRDAIERVHDAAYVDRVFAACRGGANFIDTPDSGICPASAEIAQLAAGGAIAAVDAVMQGEVRNAFCALRPPGHHAERDRSMGFCLFNNIAIAAQHLIDQHDLRRIAIVDFDVHHRNGTQHLFESRADVLFISMHEDPRYLYPGTGFAEERGVGAGEGCTLNIPLPPGSDDSHYDEAMHQHVLPALREYHPQFLLVSAGFDAAAADPLAHMHVTADGFAQITQHLMRAATEHCNGRIASMLEGGYDLDALAEGAAQQVQALMDA